MTLNIRSIVARRREKVNSRKFRSLLLENLEKKCLLAADVAFGPQLPYGAQLLQDESFGYLATTQQSNLSSVQNSLSSQLAKQPGVPQSDLLPDEMNSMLKMRLAPIIEQSQEQYSPQSHIEQASSKASNTAMLQSMLVGIGVSELVDQPEGAESIANGQIASSSNVDVSRLAQRIQAGDVASLVMPKKSSLAISDLVSNSMIVASPSDPVIDIGI